MKNIIPILAVLILILTSYSCKQAGEPAVNTYDQLAGLFKDPPAEYRTVPFWVWNDAVTKEKINFQLEEFRNKGFGGVFIHPRYGMITEYLSDEWFELVKYSVEKGKELGLYIWIYDENSYPSGFAGGHVPATMPESYNHGNALKQYKMTKLEPDNRKEYKHIFIKQDGQLVEITDRLEEYTGIEGDFYLYELIYYPKGKWYAGYSYVDLLYQGVTEKFIELTMSGYEEAVGTEFGNIIPGVFTDEPHIGPSGGRSSIRWTPDLYEVFEQRWGYDLRVRLNTLVEEEGDWKKVRHDYYETLLQMFIDRWSKPWYQYTEEKTLLWTGHYWEHDWPNPYHGGDNMAMYAWHQVPAIDMLFNTWDDRPDQFGNVRSVRELRSVANQMGRRRTLSETYGGSGHELTFQDMKRNGDWEYVLGVNLMNQHLSFMTLMGDRKHDYPQTFSYHSPWWDYYRYQNDYYGRLSMALSAGEQQNHVLVIEPTTTAWMYYNSAGDNQKLDEIESKFREFIDRMELFQIEYDLGSENILKDHGQVKDGKVVINQRSYDMVVIPPGLENLESSTSALVEEYLNQGGKILSFIPPPYFIDGENNPKMHELAKKYDEHYLRTSGELNGAEAELLAPAAISFKNPENTGGLLYHMRRIFRDGELLFLVNSSLNENTAGSVSIQGKSVVRLDPETGDIFKYPFVSEGEELYISYTLPPAGSLLLFISRKLIDAGEPLKEPEKWEAVESTGEMAVNPVKENVLVLDYCALTMGNMKEQEYYFYAASDTIFKHHGFDDNPWATSIQFKTEILDRDTFKADHSGFRTDFNFVIVRGVDYSDFKAVIERPHLYTVLVNGKEVRPMENTHWLDASFGVFSIGEYLDFSENTISLIANPMSVHCELAPVFVTGNFILKPGKEGWVISPPAILTTGAWPDQGYPFYSDIVSYSKNYSIENKTGRYKIVLGDWNGAVAGVGVNGAEAGIIYHQPYELDISDLITDGENSITIHIVGSLKNLLGPHHNVRTRDFVTPWSFRYAPDKQPPGEEYDLLDYGLMGDFELLSGI
ncbi:MAG: hypothetical protein AMS27_01220 [Bacteroides sp. SM23_62_1]|nr:MAG: hypothetical protein AMS27_01220 [Bacteroides sp. SM23_62_1]